MTGRRRTTHDTYDRVAEAFLANTRDRSRTASLLDGFAARLPPAARVVDLGAGPGCDAAELRARGLDAIALDLSMGMLRAGLRDFPGTRVRADMRRLPFARSSLAGVWANASLLHLSAEDMEATLRGVAEACALGAVMHLSLKKGSGDAWERARYGLPRWFQYWTADALDRRVEGAGWRIVERREESTQRDDWLVRLALLESSPPAG